MKVVGIEDYRVELQEVEAETLLQVPIGYRLDDAKVIVRGNAHILAVSFRKAEVRKHTSIALLMEPRPTVPLTIEHLQEDTA